MFLKKKEAAATIQNQDATSQDAPTLITREDSSTNEAEATTPVYRKPVLRRYDQIDQVKPYGPSEI